MCQMLEVWYMNGNNPDILFESCSDYVRSIFGSICLGYHEILNLIILIITLCFQRTREQNNTQTVVMCVLFSGRDQLYHTKPNRKFIKFG